MSLQFSNISLLIKYICVIIFLYLVFRNINSPLLCNELNKQNIFLLSNIRTELSLDNCLSEVFYTVYIKKYFL